MKLVTSKFGDERVATQSSILQMTSKRPLLIVSCIHYLKVELMTLLLYSFACECLRKQLIFTERDVIYWVKKVVTIHIEPLVENT